MMIFGAIVAALNDLAFNMKVKTKMSLSCTDIISADQNLNWPDIAFLTY